MKPTAEEFAEDVYRNCHNGIDITHEDFISAFLSDFNAAVKSDPAEGTAEKKTAEGAEKILRDHLNEFLWTFISTYSVTLKAGVMLKDWIITAMQEFAAQQVAEATKDCYPKEFMEWLAYDEDELFCNGIIKDEKGMRWVDEMDRENNLEEIFEYWKENVK
jgi:hypothetical protein